MNSIRPTRHSDLVVLQQIELAAGALFRDVGMPDIADNPLPTIEALAAFQEADRSWVTVDDDDQPIAFVLVMIVDGLAHVEQVSVSPAYARQGLGRRLIDHVDAWAVEQGMAALTLTTFRGVPWNGPYYQRIGFVTLAAEERGPELTQLMVQEAAHGLDPAERIAMRRPTRLHR
ncbi:GNAT family N-acetyltransferase [Actinoplanes friuliensis]|uniref:Acetyltransferase n=1 Tax=Actinoplanes friuliensis DSM 7358 TaxID=1246995 RepID=U5VND0_9ACTN|nr:GNAT family N-acetyltransferase [Actinoplanes friuliensis]AGZ38307.1 acetyltransferase [Actinoplanes friuliensis DSM 7358]